MLFEDRTDGGYSFAKDPAVIRFGGKYYLYYSNHYAADDTYGIGVAESDDLTHFTIVNAMRSEQEAEGRGICAPAAIVLHGVVHLFYQSYGQFPRDFICHATSTDGVHFTRDPSNPVFCPQGAWNCGRAIDADVTVFGDKLLLYWASRDPEMKVQLLGVSAADMGSGFSRGAWTQLDMDESVLKPELPWEQICIEAPASLTRNGKVYLFYAGAYNCCPQQIGCAVSEDGVHFKRLFVEKPLLGPGPKGSWNECESGHPYIFEDEGRYHLFYQGSDDMGKTWRLSRCEIQFNENDIPYIVR